jgi:hypothetical protein
MGQWPLPVDFILSKERRHAEAEYFDRYTVGNHIPGIDQFSAAGKYFIYFHAVRSGAIGGDSVAD